MVEVEKGPDNLLPADVLVHGIENPSLAVDFSVVHPLQPSADLAEVRPWKVGSPGRESTGLCASFPHVVDWDGLSVLSSSKPRVPGAAKPSS